VDPALLTSMADAEIRTGGLLEFNALPTITWHPAYVARVQADPVGDFDPTPAEIDSSPQTSCMLYVNMVNTARRSGSINRTSFMYTLDRMGYRGAYDVYDLQGFGNTNNDLGGRANVAQASGYALIVHDTGRLRSGPIPNGSDRASTKVNQAGWYRSYLSQGLTGLMGTATLWVIGENWAAENASNLLVNTDMGLVGIADEQGLGSDPDVIGVAAFTFENGCVGAFTGDLFQLRGGECQEPRAFDVANETGTAVVIHKYRAGTSASVGGAILMNRDLADDSNTIAMLLNWFDMRWAPGAPVFPDEEVNLAGKILTCVLPLECLRTPNQTDVALEQQIQALPRVTALFQNVPNPFNPITTIPFDLAQPEHVRVRIYDLAGRLVRRLVDEPMPPQRHRLHWNGLDDSGRPLASGVYLCRLEAGTFSATRKLVVLK
jgi:hypothetical protein